MSATSQPCIVGAALTEFSWDSGRTAERMAIEVATVACRDAGVDPTVIDGAGAVLIPSADRAGDGPHRPVRLAGMAGGHADSADDIVNRRDIFNTGLTKAAPRAFAMAGVRPSDVDAAMVYDCFTFEVIQQLEEAGSCPRGDGGDAGKRQVPDRSTPSGGRE